MSELAEINEGRLERSPIRACLSCYAVIKMIRVNRGSYLLLLFLFLFFIIPGVFYLLYMATGTFYQCPKCKKRDNIPLNTGRGQELFERLAETEKQKIIKTLRQ